MSSNAKGPTTTSDDIDLLVLVERSIAFFKRYKWVFIVAILLGLAFGLYKYFTLPRVYKSRMIIHSFLLTNQEAIQLTANWNELLKKGEHAGLSSRLNCDVNILYCVKQIKADEIQKVFNPTNPNGFTIDVMVTDNAVLDSLEKGIVHGFESGYYIKEKLLVKKANLRELIDKTTVEIQKLDSTKSTLENIIGGKKPAPSSLIVDGASINRQLIEMNEKLLYFKESLQFTNAVQVLQSFSKFKRPAGPHLLPWLVIGLVLSFALAYVFALVHSINQKLKMRSGQQSPQS